MLFTFLTVVQALIAAMLVGIILVQKSEGGGLGVGGSPSSLMSARGAADLMTRGTAILATLFVVLSILLAAMAVKDTTGRDIDTSLKREVSTGTPAPASQAPVDPLAGAANPATSPTPAVPAKGAAIPADPLSGAAKQ